MWPRTFAFLMAASATLACECRQLTECQLAGLPVVFIGKVVAGGIRSLRDDPWLKQSKSVRLEVVEVFRGLSPSTKFVDVQTFLEPGMCNPNPYRPGRTYLVSPYLDELGKFRDGGCFRGRDVEDVSDTIEYLHRHFRGPRQFQIRGRVAATPRDDLDLLDDWLHDGEAKPLQGVKVETSAKGKTFSTVTDALGRFELVVPGPGQYLVQANLAPYQPAKALASIPQDQPCKVKNVYLLSNSSISGKVWDSNGKPLESTVVGLIDVDLPPATKSPQTRFRLEYTAKGHGTFLFRNVPLGRYLLAFNPNGPEEYKTVPLETTFYPQRSNRAQAQMIVIDRAGMRLVGKDIFAGPPVALRAVNVRVRFPDGSPMTTAVVIVDGEPLDPGGIAWRKGRLVGKGRTGASFQVPVNRKIRISVNDWHGRNLKKAYESTHAPGTTPITREFIVIP